MSAMSGDFQARLDEVRARVQEATANARARVDEVRSKVGAGNGLGLGFMDRFAGGTTSPQRGTIINKIKARSRSRPILGKVVNPQRTRRTRTSKQMRKSLANKPHIADDTYAQNSKQNTKAYSQALSVEL